MRKPLISLLILFFCVGLAGILSGSEDLAKGTKAPDFKLPSTEKEQTITLSDFVSKKIVIVHFWKSM
jgi:hypothetical protein